MARPPDPHPVTAGVAQLVSRRIVRPQSIGEGIVADLRDPGGHRQASTYTSPGGMETFTRIQKNVLAASPGFVTEVRCFRLETTAALKLHSRLKVPVVSCESRHGG